MKMLNTNKLMLVVLLVGGMTSQVHAMDDEKPAKGAGAGYWDSIKGSVAENLDYAASFSPIGADSYAGLDGWKKNVARTGVATVLSAGLYAGYRGVKFACRKAVDYYTSRNKQVTAEETEVKALVDDISTEVEEQPVVVSAEPTPVVEPAVVVEQPVAAKKAPVKSRNLKARVKKASSTRYASTRQASTRQASTKQVKEQAKRRAAARNK